MVGGENIKIIVEFLKINQNELKCEGAQNISRLINSKEIELSPTAVKNLIEKIRFIATEKKITLPWEINEDVLKGKISLSTDKLLKKIDDYENQSLILEEINYKLLSLDNKNSINFLKDIILRMKLKKYKNDFLINECSHKLLQLDINKEDKLRVYGDLIMTNMILGEYNTVILLCKIIDKDIMNSNDDTLKENFLGNFSLAYSRLEKVSECKTVLSRIQNFTKVESELGFLTTAAKCEVLSKNYSEAEKINLKILDKSIKKYLYDYTVNSCSNLADICMAKNDMYTARTYINKGLEYLCDKTKPIYIYNFYFNYMLLEINSSLDLDKIEEIFIITLNASIQIKNTQLQKKAINTLIGFYINSNNVFMIEKTLEILKKSNIEIEAEVFLKILKAINNKDKMYELLMESKYDII